MSQNKKLIKMKFHTIRKSLQKFSNMVYTVIGVINNQIVNG